MVPELSKNRHVNLSAEKACVRFNTAFSAEVVSSFRDVDNSRKKAFTVHPQQLVGSYAYMCLTEKNNKRKQGGRGGQYGKTVDYVFVSLCVYVCVQA